MIDRSSPEYMFGQIMARLQEGDKSMNSMADEIKGMKNVIGNLPCRDHGKMISDIGKLQEDMKKEQVKKIDNGINLRQGLIIAVVGAAAGAGFGLLFSTIASAAQAAGG